MKVKAVYTTNDHEDGRTSHVIVHDGGSFVVSEARIGLALAEFLNNATMTDLSVLHAHLLTAYHRLHVEMDKLAAEHEDEAEHYAT